MKKITVEIHYWNRKETVTGTLDYLKEYFGYTLQCGKSWENERGARKVNMDPKTGRSFVNALNNAEHNRAANGCPSTWYKLA